MIALPIKLAVVGILLVVAIISLRFEEAYRSLKIYIICGVLVVWADFIVNIEDFL